MKLSRAEVKKKLKKLKGWQLKRPKFSFGSHFEKQNSLYKTFKFDNFLASMRFLNKLAIIAEKQEHHPDFLLHDWNKVSIWITTHSEGGITDWDFDLAEAIERIK